jgi:hypothetical protein
VVRADPRLAQRQEKGGDVTPEMAARILAFESTMLQYQGIRPSPERIRQAARALGLLGGSVRGGRKAEAARINGRKGGRPRKEQR